MKILLVMPGFLPGKQYGGPVSSIYNLIELLGENFEFYVICKDHDLNSKERYVGIKDGWNSVGGARVLYLSDNKYKYKYVSKIISEINPDILYLSSVMSPKINFPLIWWGEKNGKKIILAPRGELNKLALSKKSLKKRIYLKLVKFSKILNNVILQATSLHEEKDILSVLDVEPKNVIMIPNVPTLQRKKDLIIKKSNYLKIVTVARIVPNKNILKSIELVKKLNINITYDIYGPIEDVLYWNSCVNQMKNLPENIKINYCGNLNPIESKNIYAHYDCMLLLTEFENYGQVIAESLLSDCPIVISKGTTPWDDIVEYEGGFIVSLDEEEEFIETLDYIGKMDSSDYNKLVLNTRQYISEKIDIELIKDQYIYLFK